MKKLSTSEKGEGIAELLICKKAVGKKCSAIWLTLRSTLDIGYQQIEYIDSSNDKD